MLFSFMKKSIIIFFVLGICNFANAQFTANNSPNAYLQINNLTDIDAVFLFNGITLNSEITCTTAGNVRWLDYGGNLISSGQPTLLSFDDGEGYICEVEQTDTILRYWIWVIDYSLYPAVVNYLQVAPFEQNFCENLTLAVNITVPDLVYYDKKNVRRTLTRSFSLDYVDYAFNGESWQDSTVTVVVAYPFTQITIPAPKQDVTFVLSGDNFAEQMNIVNPETSFSLDYKAVAVKSYLKGTVEKRSVPPTDQPNENLQDSSKEDVAGSAPLVVEFKSRANTPVAAYFEWIIYNENTPSITHQYPNENIRYTFIEKASYWVKLRVMNSNSSCIYRDSVRVILEKSQLDVPNFFTPNGDGVNDEWRVAYTSIKNYKCVVFNRWGSVVFTSTDPNKGWDGNVRGRPAAEGTYYYIITATAINFDQEENKEKLKQLEKKHGTVNLFRGYR